ncbi:MAG TPA: FAD:protein FMN transferase [Pyrinomonadaceae bacterium]|nr:FAD:protein FMN transferase [Pyrinomonadaceae bacterium]
MLQATRRAFLSLRQSRVAAGEEYWLHVNRTAMACRVEVTLHQSTECGVSIASNALDQVEEIERQLSIFKAESAVSEINRDAATEAVRVDRSLFDLLSLCRKLHAETEGAFDVTSGPLTRCWGFLKREGRLPSNDEIERARATVGSDKLVLDEALTTVAFKQPGVEINLGSIGKGYALDVVSEHFRKANEPALLSAGASSFLATGAERAWLVGVRHPRSKQKRLASVRLHDCAMSTSGTEEQFFNHGGRRFGHIIDSRTGWPAENVSSVTVIADSAALSDALATAFFVGGRQLTEHYCEKHQDVLAIMLETNAQRPIVIGNNKNCVVELF